MHTSDSQPHPQETGQTQVAENLTSFIRENSGAEGKRVLRCRTTAAGLFRQVNHVRDLRPQRIEHRTGKTASDASDHADSGAPTPAETLLSALGSCIAIGIQANAVARGVPIREICLEIEAEFDPTAAWGLVSAEPARMGFETIRIDAHLDSEAPRGVLEALLAHAVLWSPVSNTLHNPVHVQAALARTAASRT